PARHSAQLRWWCQPTGLPQRCSTVLKFLPQRLRPTTGTAHGASSKNERSHCRRACKARHTPGSVFASQDSFLVRFRKGLYHLIAPMSPRTSTINNDSSVGAYNSTATAVPCANIRTVASLTATSEGFDGIETWGSCSGCSGRGLHVMSVSRDA